MKLNINEIRKIIVEELQILSESDSPNRRNTVTDFDDSFDYAYFKGPLERSVWWARGKNDRRQKQIEDTRWFGRSPQFLGPDDQGFVWVKVPASAQRTLTAANQEIVSKSEERRAEREAAPEAPQARRNITTRIDDILRTMDVDVYGPVIGAVDKAARGDFGPRVAERAESLLKMTETLSPLKKPFESPGYDSSEMSAGAPLRAKLASLTSLRKIPTGGDMGHGGLVYNLLARSAGIPVRGGTSIEVAIIGSLTGNADEFMRQFDRAVTALEVVKGEVKGTSASNPKRYVKNAFKDLDLVTQGDRVRNEEDAQAVKDRAASLIRTAERAAELSSYGVDALRGKLDSDDEVKRFLAGIIPTDEESLRQFI